VTDHLFFLIGFAFLLTHEMDAIRCREWRIFPILGAMGEEAGYVAFTALHVPLYALLFWGLTGADGPNRGLIFALNIFFVVHLILHIALRNHPENRFGSPLSWALFAGAGVCGAIDLLLSLR